MNTGVDNIEVDPKTGDLWIGCHPVMYRILDLQHIFKFSLPSNVSSMTFSINKWFLFTSNHVPCQLSKKFTIAILSSDHQIKRSFCLINNLKKLCNSCLLCKILRLVSLYVNWSK